VKKTFSRHFPDPEQQKKQERKSIYKPVLDWFADGNCLELTDYMSQKDYEQKLDQVTGLADIVESKPETKDRAIKYVLMDFVIEALHQYSMVGKEDLDDSRSYSDMLGSMLGSMDDFDDFDDFDR
jgi:magnesium chelatase subunit I